MFARDLSENLPESQTWELHYCIKLPPLLVLIINDRLSNDRNGVVLEDQIQGMVRQQNLNDRGAAGDHKNRTQGHIHLCPSLMLLHASHVHCLLCVVGNIATERLVEYHHWQGIAQIFSGFKFKYHEKSLWLTSNGQVSTLDQWAVRAWQFLLESHDWSEEHLISVLRMLDRLK